MTDAAPVVVEHLGAVTRLTLNRPERHNPLTGRCIEEIVSAVRAAESDPSVHVLVIRGSGRSFSSGYGVVPEDARPGETQRPETLEDDIDAMRAYGAAWAQVWGCRLPVIAQVHGWCLAGGTDLALHCDFVVVAEDARIGFPPVRSMGVPPTHMWLYHVGPQWAKRLLLTGDTLSGTEAAAIGLALVAVPVDVLDDYVLALANRMALIGRDLLIANKRVVNEGVELMGRSRLQEISAVYDAAAHASPPAREFSARVAKIGLRDAVRERDAVFKGPLPGPTVTS